MPHWTGDDHSRSAGDQREAKAVADLAKLVQAAQAADTSLGALLDTPPPWMRSGVRVRAVAVREACKGLAPLVEHLRRSLIERRRPE